MKDKPLLNEEKQSVEYWTKHWFDYYNKINAFCSEFNLLNGNEKIIVWDKESRFVPLCGDEVFKVNRAEFESIKKDKIDRFCFSGLIKLIGNVDGVTVDTLIKKREFFLKIEFFAQRKEDKLSIEFDCYNNLIGSEIFPESEALDLRNSFIRQINSGNPKIELRVKEYKEDGKNIWRAPSLSETRLISCVLVSLIRNIAVSCDPETFLKDKGVLELPTIKNKHKNFGTW